MQPFAWIAWSGTQRDVQPFAWRGDKHTDSRGVRKVKYDYVLDFFPFHNDARHLLLKRSPQFFTKSSSELLFFPEMFFSPLVHLVFGPNEVWKKHNIFLQPLLHYFEQLFSRVNVPALEVESREGVFCSTSLRSNLLGNHIFIHQALPVLRISNLISQVWLVRLTLLSNFYLFFLGSNSQTFVS